MGDTMNIAVCDDEQIMRKELIKQIHECYTGSIRFHIIEFEDGKELTDAYQKGGADFDIILLDIEMKGLDGIHTAKWIRQYDQEVVIIFVTNLQRYALLGYEVKAFHYLIKPVTKEKFQRVQDAALQTISSRAQKYLLVDIREEFIKIPIHRILYIENFSRKVTIFYGNSSITCYRKMADMEKELDEWNFIRVHEAFIVNMQYIKSINKGDLEMVLENGKTIPVSRRRMRNLSERFMDYLR